MTKLDETLFALIDTLKDWAGVLEPVDVRMLKMRRRGATLKEIADKFGMTPAGVRRRLYGAGTGRVRHGGAFGRLRGLAMRERNSATRGA